MRTKVKYAVINRHRNEYAVSVMCKFFEVSRSGYYDFVSRIGKAERDAELAKKIQECQDRTDKTYGYRRVWKWLKDKNIERNPKTVLRVMKKYGLLSEIRRRRKWINLGQQVHKYKNLLNRQFRTDRPNTKWVTDISYVHTKEGVLCLLRTIFLETTYASCSGSTPASISNFVFLRIFGAFKASPSLSPTLPMKR